MLPLLAAPASDRSTPGTGDLAAAFDDDVEDLLRLLKEKRHEHRLGARFLERVGQTGGGVAVHRRDASLGLARPPAAGLSPPPAARPRGTRVIVLGAGLAGLTAAYELQKLGYEGESPGSAPANGRPLLHGPARAVSEEAGTPRRRRRSTATCTSTPDRRGFRTITPRRSPTAASLASRSRRSAASTKRHTVHQSRHYPRAKLRLREVRADWRGPHSGKVAKAVTQRCARSADDGRGSRAHDRVVEVWRADSSPETALHRIAPAGDAVGTRCRHNRRSRRRSAPRSKICFNTGAGGTFRPSSPCRRRCSSSSAEWIASRARSRRRARTSRSASTSRDRAAGGTRPCEIPRRRKAHPQGTDGAYCISRCR